MTVTFYKCNDDNNVANKTLTNATTYNIKAYNIESLISPHIIMSYNATLLQFNYVKLFDRYYRVVDFVLNNNDSVTIYLTLDAVLTYWNSIKNCNATIIRTGNRPTAIADSSLPVNPNEKIFEGIRVQNSVGSPCYVIQLKGAE